MQLAVADWLVTTAAIEVLSVVATAVPVESVGLTTELAGELNEELEELDEELDEATAVGVAEAVEMVVGEGLGKGLGELVVAAATDVDEINDMGILPPQASSPSLQHQVAPFPSLAQ